MARYKQEAYEQAIAFRKRGFTYSEIAKICNVSRGTVSNWLSPLPFSEVVAKDNAKKAILTNTKRLAAINKARNTERAHKYTEAIHQAESEYKHYKNNPLFVAGLMLYLTLGDKHDPRTIRLSTSEFGLHRTFITFSLEYLAIQKTDIHFWLLLYPQHDELACMKRWSKKIGLSPAQFYKNQIVESRSNRNKIHYGIGNLVFNSTLHKKKLEHWMKLLNKEL